MHTVRLLLKLTEYDRQILGKRFHAVSHIHNVLVKHAKKQLQKLYNDQEYVSRKTEYTVLLKKEKDKEKKTKLSRQEKELKKQLSAEMNQIIKDLGLSEYGFQAYIKICGEMYSKCLSSQQVQKEATRVWSGVRDVLYGNGNEIHFKKYRDFDTVCGKSNQNGVRFYKDGFITEWMGLSMKCRIPKNNDYIMEALKSDISYCEIQRKMFPNGWHYYVVLYLKGNAPEKITQNGNTGNVTGIDIGTSTIAAVSDDLLMLKELAPKCHEYNIKIKKVSKHMDLSLRALNPGKYRPDGTIDRNNHDRWVYSRTYLKNRDLLKTLYRKKSAYIKQSHEEMIKELIRDSSFFVVEKMSFRGLQKKAKKTERSEKTSDIRQKDGTTKQIHKYKRKKRFGKSLNNRAPAEFIEILTKKAELYGGAVYKVDAIKFKASQYDHVSDTYTKHSIHDRERNIDGNTVQRDLYSAFLLKNTDNNLEHADRDKCIYEFTRFLKQHDKLITEMKHQNISMKQCFGF